MPNSQIPARSNNNNDSQTENNRGRIRETRPVSDEDLRRVKRLAQQLVERIDDLQKRSRG